MSVSEILCELERDTRRALGSINRQLDLDPEQPLGDSTRLLIAVR